jgi:hypothetical protein
MGYKEPPTKSIEEEGGIEVHINNFLAKIGSDKRYEDVVRLKHLKIGKKKVSPQQAADEVGVKSRNTMISWWKQIDKQNSQK